MIVALRPKNAFDPRIDIFDAAGAKRFPHIGGAGMEFRDESVGDAAAHQVAIADESRCEQSIVQLRFPSADAKFEVFRRDDAMNADVANVRGIPRGPGEMHRRATRTDPVVMVWLGVWPTLLYRVETMAGLGW